MGTGVRGREDGNDGHRCMGNELMGWSLGWAGLQRTSVSEAVTEVRRASAISLAPSGPIQSLDASMELILLSSLLQTPAKISPQPLSPKLLFLRLRPPLPMLVSRLTRRASAIA